MVETIQVEAIGLHRRLNKMWHNGERRLMMVAGIVIAALLFVTLLNFFYSFQLLARAEEIARFTPLGEYSTQLVDAPRDASGIPTVALSEKFVAVVARKCNLSDKPVTVFGGYDWAQIRDDDTIVRFSGSTSSGTREVGCATHRYMNPIPQGLMGGLWKLKGIEIATDGHLTQQRAWETEPFRIVEK